MALGIVLLFAAWKLIAGLMVPIMYRRNCRAYEAFRTVASLIAAYPGEILLFCLFFVALAIGTAFVACFATCLTCCLAALPYIGAVILLPIYVLLTSFTLCFLRQFGSDYDVWQVPPPLEPPPVLNPI
jgi:hypothetical protein